MTQDSWKFLVFGYLATITLETPVLVIGLSRRHGWKTKLFAGAWLTACTYPIVILTLPSLTGEYYTLAAECFAAIAETLLFRWLVARASLRDMTVVAAANAFSFLAGFLFLG
jgi:hypothetical protein